MAFQKAVKGTVLVGGGALATVLGLSQFAHYRRKQVSKRMNWWGSTDAVCAHGCVCSWWCVGITPKVPQFKVILRILPCDAHEL